MGDPIPEHYEPSTKTNDSEKKDQNNNSKSALKRTQTKEADNEITEIRDALSDPVTSAIFWRIVEEGACAKKDLETMDAVVKESETLLRELREYGIIKVEKGIVTLTEEGRKALAYLERDGNKVRRWTHGT